MKTNSRNSQPITDQRIDSWLWASRFYKTRKLSSDAITAGHVRLNGAKPKPGKSVKPGDELTIKKNQQEFNIVIEAIAPKRLGAALAQKLYSEPQWSIDKRENETELRKNSRLGVTYDRSRPNKRDRKLVRDLKYQNPDPQ